MYSCSADVVGDRAHLEEPADAVVAMHHQVAGRELQHERLARGVAAGGAPCTARRGGLGAARAARQQRTAPLDGAEQLGVGVHVHRAVSDRESLRQVGRSRPRSRRREVVLRLPSKSLASTVSAPCSAAAPRRDAAAATRPARSPARRARGAPRARTRRSVRRSCRRRASRDRPRLARSAPRAPGRMHVWRSSALEQRRRRRAGPCDAPCGSSPRSSSWARSPSISSAWRSAAAIRRSRPPSRSTIGVVEVVEQRRRAVADEVREEQVDALVVHARRELARSRVPTARARRRGARSTSRRPTAASAAPPSRRLRSSSRAGQTCATSSLRDRLLGREVEGAQVVDVVAEPLGAPRPRAVHAEDVDDAAAHREVAGTDTALSRR